MKKLFLVAAVVMAAAGAAVAVAACGGGGGEKYKEIAGLASPEGGEIRLSEVVEGNRYTLLDFWASWCGPCIAELPYMRAAYEKYHDRGFEIYGVSYDQDGDAWRAMIESEGMDWVHVSALRGWNCPTQPLYGVNAIPRNYLIDSRGNIVAKNLRGEALAKKLEEIL